MENISNKISEKIIIFFHIYYIDLLDEYLWYLNNIKKTKYNFDLYVSLCQDVETIETINKLKEFDPNVKIKLCENRGADIGGFISSLRNYEIDFDLYTSVLYLHTKKSATYGLENSYLWRGELLNDILINSDLIEYCVNQIKENNVGIIGSSRCVTNIDLSLDLYNIEKSHYETLCNILSITPNKNMFFIAGTIFWANPKIFKIIQNSSIVPDNFKKIFLHNGLLEHGFERIFGSISESINLSVLGMKLDINNPVYYNSFIIFKNHKKGMNINIFKISESIILPYENIINHIKRKKNLNRQKNNILLYGK